jgi:hypothetical protein
MMRLAVVLISLCACFAARAASPVALDVPVSLAPNGAVEHRIKVDEQKEYKIALMFARDGIPADKLKELIGAMGACKIGAECSSGIVVPIRWTLRRADTGELAASRQIDSFESHGWSAADVERSVGAFAVSRGSYVFRLEVLREVPELSALRTRVVIYRRTK